jgi:cellulose synthase/poly-beta-1,6-N-acetylglucosamine synthase-like glycosyltransferase
MDWLSILWLCCYIPVVIGLSLFGLHRWSMVILFWKNWKNPPRPKANMEQLPMVTVQLPIFNELHVVRRLVDSVAKLDWPRELLQIQILDDSTDETREICQEELERLRREGFDAELIHRVDRTGFKAGALENGMATAKGEFIYILDADFLPPRDVLHKLVHFFSDDKIALVQSRWGHINRDYSLLTKIQAIFLDGHLVVEQVARSRSGRFFNFNGTGGMWRKQAIVDSGGWEHDTLTEDLDLSYRAQMKGWRFIYLNDVVTPAELPVDMNGFKTQQFRWTKGSIQCCRKLFGSIWRSKEPLWIKLEATAHLCTNFAYLLLCFLCFLIFPGTDRGLTEWLGPELRAWLVDVPVFVLTAISVGLFYITGQIGSNRQGWLRRAVYLPGALALGIGLAVNSTRAIIEALMKKESPFVRTPKYGIEKKGQDYKKAKYKSLKSIGMGLELLLAIYFTIVTIYGILENYWLSVPFYLLFTFGFWYVVVGSLPQLFQSRSPESSGGTPPA